MPVVAALNAGISRTAMAVVSKALHEAYSSEISVA